MSDVEAALEDTHVCLRFPLFRPCQRRQQNENDNNRNPHIHTYIKIFKIKIVNTQANVTNKKDTTNQTDINRNNFKGSETQIAYPSEEETGEGME